MGWKDVLKAPVWDLKVNGRVATTKQFPIVFKDRPVGNLGKPKGLWYSFGGWSEYMKNISPSLEQQYTHLVEIKIGGRILKLESEQDYLDMFEKYPNKRDIDWKSVKQDYDVIEFHNVVKMGNIKFDSRIWSLADDLDVDSGVILNEAGIKSQKLIGERKSKGRAFKRSRENRPFKETNKVHGKWEKVKGESMEKVAGAVTTSSAPAMFNVRYSDGEDEED